MKIVELMIEELGYQGTHLGGSRNLDDVCYSEGPETDYGLIIDTKAYLGGYSLQISQADEMGRYIR